MDSSRKWDQIIKNDNSVFSFSLKEIWECRDLIVIFVKRDISTIYKQTIMGPIWFILQPIFPTILFLFVFDRIAQLGTEGIPAVIYYLSGNIFWAYFSGTFLKTSNFFPYNTHIFSKVYFPRITVPISILISNLISFGIQLLLFVAVYCYYLYTEDLKFNWTLLIIPLYILQTAIFALGGGLFFSAISTKYKDMMQILNYMIQMLLYLTPIIVPISKVSAEYKILFYLNPITSVVEGVRYAFFTHSQLDPLMFIFGWGFTILTLLLGIIVFNKVEKTFIDHI